MHSNEDGDITGLPFTIMVVGVSDENPVMEPHYYLYRFWVPTIKRWRMFFSLFYCPYNFVNLIFDF